MFEGCVRVCVIGYYNWCARECSRCVVGCRVSSREGIPTASAWSLASTSLGSSPYRCANPT